MLWLLLRALDGEAILGIEGLGARLARLSSVWTRSGRAIADSHVHNRVVPEVLIPSDDGVPMLVLEADAGAACGARVQAIEVLDGGDDGLSGVVRVDLYPHG